MHCSSTSIDQVHAHNPISFVNLFDDTKNSALVPQKRVRVRVFNRWHPADEEDKKSFASLRSMARLAADDSDEK